MSVQVLEACQQKVRCQCGALLGYSPKDVHRGPPPPGTLPTHMGCVFGGWPWIQCPECWRAVLVSGCF